MSASVNRWKLISGLLLVLVLGILVGSLGTGLYLKHRFSPFARGAKSKETYIIEKLSRELKLSPSQRDKIAPIVKQMIDKRREYFSQIRPEVKRIMDQGFSQIKQVLNEDQKKKLDALREKYERRRAERRAKRFGK